MIAIVELLPGAIPAMPSSKITIYRDTLCKRPFTPLTVLAFFSVIFSPVIR